MVIFAALAANRFAFKSANASDRSLDVCTKALTQGLDVFVAAWTPHPHKERVTA